MNSFSQRFRWVACVVFLGMASAYAQEGDGPRTGTVHEVEVALNEPMQLLDLAEAGFNISSVDGNTAVVNATDAELDALTELGFNFSTRRAPLAGSSEAKAGPEYRSFDALSSQLQQLAIDYGPGQSENADLCRLYSLGDSVDGRELWAVLITDNPDIEEDEPEFKYIATMHGDEVLGTEMCMRFLELLLDEYGTDALITELVNETAIWIVPLMNPDGYESGTRANANGFDLNRNFPKFPEDWNGTAFAGAPLDAENRQPETQHVMAWSAANSFVLSANFHGGALVVNYPYDDDNKGSLNDAPSPDDLVFEEISRRYASNNLPMFTTPIPSNATGGIINGSRWFEITGGMQDWNYRYLGCNDVTIEISTAKQPAASLIDLFWEDNRDAMFAYFASVHMGLRGIVTDANSGEPVYAAIHVAANNQPVFTDPDVGDYHRMLLPGTYDITISAPGYASKQFEDVIAAEPATRLDVQLQPLGIIGDVNQDGVVNASDIQLVINARFGTPIQHNADVNQDGVVNSLDVQLVVNALLAG